MVYGLIRAKVDHYTRTKTSKNGYYIDVKEGNWGTDEHFQYDDLLYEAMLDESTLGEDYECDKKQITKKRLCELNVRLKSMSEIPKQKIDPSYIKLLQDYVDERKPENVNKLQPHYFDWDN